MISSIPKRSLRNLVIFAGALGVVVGVLVVPSYFAVGKTETQKIKIETEVKEQRQLAPVFGQLVKKRRELNQASAELPKRAALARDDAGGIADAWTQLAAENQMQMVGINLDLNALVNDARLMQVDFILRGKLSAYHGFLQKFITVPHVAFIERLRIMAIPGDREYRMRVWVAVK